MRPLRLLFGLLLLGAAGCSESPATQPSPITPPISATATAVVVAVTVDGLGSQEAIAGVSNVTVDASGSTGDGLRYTIAFGDGDTASTAVARHVYQSAGSFTVTVTVTDGNGRQTTSTRPLVVASPLGRWVHSGFIQRRREVEVRTLTLMSQAGATLRGTLTRDGNRTIPVTATLSADRAIRVTLDDGSEVLEGRVPSVFSTATTWLLTSRGGSIDDQSLTFARAAADPTGAPPDAVLKMRFFSFGAPFAVKQISPVLFDGSTSHGDGLTYYIEFGDGESTTAASVTHPMQKEGAYVARLTVVDRFGRADVETLEFEARSLVTQGWNVGWRLHPTFCLECHSHLKISSQEGRSVVGELVRNGIVEQFSGTISADGHVQLRVSGSAVALTGQLTLPTSEIWEHRLRLTYSGGPFDGRTALFYYSDGD